MDSEKEQLERKHQLERDVADAILALASGKGYLGIEVPDDRRGCLQDVHWSGGGIGYCACMSHANRTGVWQ